MAPRLLPRWVASSGALAVAVGMAALAAAHSSAAFTTTTSSGGNVVHAAAAFPCVEPAVTFVANADVYVSSANNVNTGSDTVLSVRHHPTGARHRTLVRFPLPAVPVDCIVATATLRLLATMVAADRTIEVRRAATAWVESSVQWSESGGTGTAVAAASGTGWRSWSVTEQVAAQLAGSNHGFMMQDRGDGSGSVVEQQYSSREGANPPELALTFMSRPGGPTGLVATASGTSIALVWDDAAGETGYRIERSPAGAGAWAEVGTVGADTTTFLDTTTAAATAYDYRIRSAWPGGLSWYSATATATTGS